MKFSTSIALLLLAPAGTVALSLRNAKTISKGAEVNTKKSSAGPSQGTTKKFSGGTSFEQGLSNGKYLAERIWKNDFNSDCANIWTFEEEIEDVLADYNGGRNWRARSHNRGTRSGAEEVVAKYEEECLESDPEECNALGEDAAAQIAYDYCPPEHAMGAYGMAGYKKTCRQVATNVCQGEVGSAVENRGCSITTSETLILQRKCKDQVERMTNNDDGLLNETE